jgi:hypothetical protein
LISSPPHAVNKLLLARSTSSTNLQTTLTSLSTLNSDFTSHHAASTTNALKQLSLLSRKQEEEEGKAEELRRELGGLRRKMREYNEAEQAANGGVGGLDDGEGIGVAA